MKLHLTKAQTFEVDPKKKYLVLVSTPQAMTQKDVEEANAAIRAYFPNMSVVSFKPGTRFKVVEGE